MNLLGVIYLLCAFISFESSVTVLRIRGHGPVNILYGIFSLNFCLFCVFFIQFLLASSMETAWIWNRINVLPGVLLTSFFLHFVLCMAKGIFSRYRDFLVAVLYLPPLFFAGQLFSGKIITGIFPTSYGWDNFFDTESVLTLMVFVQNLLYLLSGIAIIFFRANGSSLKYEKDQARPLMIAVASGVMAFCVCLFSPFSRDEFFITLLSDTAFVIHFTLFILGVRYSVWKYHLMVPGPGWSVSDLIAGIREPAFLANIQGHITCGNREAEDLVRETGSSDKGTVQDLFSCSRDIVADFNAIAAGRACFSALNCTLGNTGAGIIPCTLTLQGIRNREDECTAIMLIVHEEPGVMEFQERYRITGRQMEILFLVLSGCTNREIAMQLNISERTVENHLFNIYNRLGIDNRIELMNICRRYNILSN